MQKSISRRRSEPSTAEACLVTAMIGELSYTGVFKQLHVSCCCQSPFALGFLGFSPHAVDSAYAPPGMRLRRIGALSNQSSQLR